MDCLFTVLCIFLVYILWSSLSAYKTCQFGLFFHNKSETENSKLCATNYSIAHERSGEGGVKKYLNYIGNEYIV